jgi:haloalkane dehalogenase
VKVLRTPEARFVALPDFPFEPRHVEIAAGDGSALRMSYLDEGPADAPVVLMLHGEPSWSFLYREVIARLSAAGLRAVAPDLIGFGRSDKPAERADHSYERQVAWTTRFVEALDLRDVTLVCHDWGGLIGLRLVAEHPARFAQVIAANTALPTGDGDMPEAFHVWRQRSQEIRRFPTGRIISDGCARPLTADLVAAYDAPFPDESYQAGARALPVLVPITADDPAAPANDRAWQSLERFTRPVLTVWGDGDPYTAPGLAALRRRVPGAAGQPHAVIAGAGHFLQEDAGAELAEITLAAMTRLGLPSSRSG